MRHFCVHTETRLAAEHFGSLSVRQGWTFIRESQPSASLRGLSAHYSFAGTLQGYCTVLAVLLGMAAKSVRGVDQMPKLPDVSGYSFDELSRLVSLATKRMDEIRGKRIKELQAELGRLGADGDPAPRRGRTNGRSVEATGRTARRRANGSGGRLRHSSGAPMAKSTRDEAPFPNGLKNWAWTIEPAWKSIAFAESLYAPWVFTSLEAQAWLAAVNILRRAFVRSIAAEA